MTHLDFERISEIADAGPPGGSGEAQHLAECAECRETLRRVRDLLAAAHALPRDIVPPPEVWTELRDHIGREPRRVARWWWRSGWMASAAAIVFFVGAALVLQGRGNKAKAVKILRPVATQPEAMAVASVDKNYSATLAELRATLDAQRATLSPATVRTVERSLALIDTAIAEARAALAADPANQILVDILASHYERKVDLLQRASELSSSN